MSIRKKKCDTMFTLFELLWIPFDSIIKRCISPRLPKKHWVTMRDSILKTLLKRPEARATLSDGDRVGCRADFPGHRGAVHSPGTLDHCQ